MYIFRFIYIYMYVYAHRHLYSTEKICCPSSSATAIWGATNDSTAHGMSLRQTEDCSLTAVQKLWDLTQWMLGSLDDVAVRRTQFCPQTEVRWIRRVASGVCYSLCKRRKKSITYFSIHTWFYVLWMCWLCMYTYTYIYIRVILQDLQSTMLPRMPCWVLQWVRHQTINPLSQLLMLTSPWNRRIRKPQVDKSRSEGYCDRSRARGFSCLKAGMMSLSAMLQLGASWKGSLTVGSIPATSSWYSFWWSSCVTCDRR